MYTRFIVSILRALGKTFSNSEKVKKIIKSLPKEWRPQRTAIKETRDLDTLTIDHLISSLISYKEDLAAERGDEDKKKTNIVLKDSRSENDEERKIEDEDIAMIARKFRKLFA